MESKAQDRHRLVLNKHGGRVLPVHIYDDGTVDNEVVNLSRSAGDEILWISEGPAFTIQFPIPPFDENTFEIPAGGAVASGSLKDSAPITYYKYSINNAALAISADPGLNIQP
jgi:hypothetical protein